MLKRQGIIGTWHDRRIGAGEDIDNTISEHLASSQVVLLLVSPYFLASDYCYDVEMRRALERHEAGDARVIPIILEPCEWQEAPFGNLRATPQDGKPVSKFSNIHDAFLQVAKDIRAAVTEFQVEAGSEDPNGIPATVERVASVETQRRSSNLRIRREFTDKDRDDFLDEAFHYIWTFFENSLVELQARNDRIETRFNEVDRTHFTCAVYSHGAKETSCKIWNSGRGGFPNGIGYATEDSPDDNSFNEALSLVDDGHSLLLKPMGFAFLGQGGQEALTKHGAAEYLWSIFIQPLQ